MTKRRVVVTGMGLVSCFGDDVDFFYNSLLEGKSGIKNISTFNTSNFPTKFAGEIENFDVGDFMHKKLARRADPFIRYAMVAGKKAVQMANIFEDSDLDRSRCGVIIGSGMGGMQSFSNGVQSNVELNYKKLTPFFVPMIISNMAGALLSIDLKFEGPNYSISTACATSSYSINAAVEQIQMGKADLMLTGGSEAAISPIGLAGFVQARALSQRNDQPQKASRPWDKARDGFVMGEGSGILVLEELSHALNRGANILAEINGGAINSDAFHMTEPKEDGSNVAKCIEIALKYSDISKDRINYINAHATSTLAGDLCEVRAFKKVFGDKIKNIKMNATKSMIGHTLGAAGGIEAITTIMAIRTKKLHPTINLENIEEEIGDLDPVANIYQNHNITGAISCSFGFGGHNSVLVFTPFEG